MIGIYGGTFNPVHNGHMRMALYAYHFLQLRKLHMVACATPPHRPVPAVTAQHRFDMLRLATLAFPCLVADDRELNRQGLSYTIDTLKEFKSESDEILCLIIGFDAFTQFHLWHQWQQIPNLAHIAVLRRKPHADVSNIPLMDRVEKKSRASELYQSKNGKIIFLNNPLFHESSTELRDSIRTGQSINHRVPLQVANYINQHHLYQNGE